MQVLGPNVHSQTRPKEIEALKDLASSRAS